MLEGVTCVLNSSSTKSTISSRYRSGFSSKYSHRASNIGGVMLRGRPTPFEGAFVEPKWRRFDFIANTERSLQPTTSAISAGGCLLSIMSRICACCDSARFGAILESDVRSSDTLVDAAVVKRPSGMSLRPCTSCKTATKLSLTHYCAVDKFNPKCPLLQLSARKTTASQRDRSPLPGCFESHYSE
jgi:hypothetical protein